jgi:hypothetical protein
LRTCTSSGPSVRWRRTSGRFGKPSSTPAVPEKRQAFQEGASFPTLYLRLLLGSPPLCRSHPLTVLPLLFPHLLAEPHSHAASSCRVMSAPYTSGRAKHRGAKSVHGSPSWTNLENFRERARLLKNSLDARFRPRAGTKTPVLGRFEPDLWSLSAQRRLFQQAGAFHALGLARAPALGATPRSARTGTPVTRLGKLYLRDQKRQQEAGGCGVVKTAHRVTCRGTTTF